MKHFSLQWHITDKCDQRCKHCYLYEGKDKQCLSELDLPILIKILDNYQRFANKFDLVPHLVLTGGDPILHSQFWELLEILKNRKLKFSILGNPFHLSESVVQKLEDCGCESYQMSLDGLKDTHDWIRKPGSFETTLNSFKFFKNSSITTIVMTTVSKSNLDQIPELVDVIVKNNINKFAFARYCPNSSDFDLIPSPEEYRDFLDKMWKKFEEYKDGPTDFKLKDHLWKLYLYEKGLFDPSNIENPDDLILDGCHCGICHLTVLADGTVYACRRCESPIGKVPEQELSEIFLGEALDEYRKFNQFEKCKDCELKNFCRGCPSVSKCLSGNFYSQDPQCWKTF